MDQVQRLAEAQAGSLEGWWIYTPEVMERLIDFVELVMALPFPLFFAGLGMPSLLAPRAV